MKFLAAYIDGMIEYLPIFCMGYLAAEQKWFGMAVAFLIFLISTQIVEWLRKPPS